MKHQKPASSAITLPAVSALRFKIILSGLSTSCTSKIKSDDVTYCFDHVYDMSLSATEPNYQLKMPP